MSISSKNDLRLGLVTQLDDYIYVWGTSLGWKELRYPLEAIPNIQEGDIVRYRQARNENDVQLSEDLVQETKASLPITKCGTSSQSKIRFKVRTTIVFPSKDYEPYLKYLKNGKPCYAVGYSPDFRKVACFLKKEYEPGRVYECVISRIPKYAEAVIPQVETLFILLNGGLTEVKDPEKIQDVIKELPWHVESSNNAVEGKFKKQSVSEILDDDFLDNASQFSTKVSVASYDSSAKKIVGDYGCTGYGKAAGETHRKQSEILDEDFLDNTKFAKKKSAADNDRNEDKKFIETYGDSKNIREEKSRNKLVLDVLDEDFLDYPPHRKEHGTGKDDKTMNKINEKYQDAGKYAANDFYSSAIATSMPTSSTGIIVRMELNYMVIWSREDDLVAIPNTDVSNLSTWVQYECFDDQPIECGNIKKTAYMVEEIAPILSSAVLENTVQVFASITMGTFGNCRSYNESFIMTYDDVLGIVLCSKDEYMIKRLKNGETVEVITVYMENYQKPSRWIAFAVNKGSNDWRKLTNLPSRVDELANISFEKRDGGKHSGMQRFKSVQRKADQISMTLETKIMTENQMPARFGPPKDWKGIAYLSDRKVSEVLGLVVEHEDEKEVSVLYTVFGLARLQKFQEVGTWMKITILEDDEGGEIDPKPIVAEHFKSSYVVIGKPQIIAPPMYTRMIPTKNIERMLVCGTVTRGPRCLENAYFGVIDDGRDVMNLNKAEAPSVNGYLVEMGLLHRAINRSQSGTQYSLAWKIMKSHGVADKNVNNWVPLEESFAPNTQGRTSLFPA